MPSGWVKASRSRPLDGLGLAERPSPGRFSGVHSGTGSGWPQGIPGAITSVFPEAQVQTCLVRMVRLLVPWTERKFVAVDLKAVYRAETVETAQAQPAFGKNETPITRPSAGPGVGSGLSGRDYPNWLAQRPRYQVHYTPTYSSWLNQVEIWFGIITKKAIRKGSFSSFKELTNKSLSSLLNTTRKQYPAPGTPPQGPFSIS
jgi:hypothetical protein